MLAVLGPDMERLDTANFVVDRPRDGQREMDTPAGNQSSRRRLRVERSVASGYRAARTRSGGLGATAGQHDGQEQQPDSVHAGVTAAEGEKFPVGSVRRLR